MSLRDSDSTKLKGDASFNFASYLADDEDLNAEYDDSVRKQLSVLQCAAICIIIEEAIDEITILGTSDDKNAEINVGLQIESLEKRAKKYIKSDPLYNEYNAEPFTTTIQKMKFTKLQIDRVYIQEILLKTKVEIFEHRNFKKLSQYLQMYHLANEDEQTLIKIEAKNKAYANNLEISVRNKVEDSKNELQQANERISNYKDDIETILYDDTLKTRYIENWENARIEQAFLTCDQNEAELMNTIEKYKNEMEKEIRIHSEIESYIAENTRDIENGIENWQKKYEIEMEDKQTEIQVLTETRSDQAKRYAIMSATFNAHAKEIEDWLDYREKKRIADELFVVETAAAIKIQAWWRGQMFRHQLGPYNPRKKRKGKGKKGDKKKKKKK